MLKIYRSNCTHLYELTFEKIEKGAWFNLINPDQVELEMVAAKTGAPLDFLKAALDEEERSRTELEDNYMLVITNIPIMRGKDSYDALPLGIIISPDYIITVCLEANEVLANFSPENARNFSTCKKTRFLFQILHKSALLYLRYLKQINRRTDDLEHHLRASMKNQEIFQLLDLQKGLTYFTASLRSNGIVLEKLLRLRTLTNLQHLITMYEEDEDLLEDVIIENKQAIEMVEMYSKVLSGLMDCFTSIISNNLNMVMKFLASMTILLAIPTMISSFMGMNVDVPFGANNGFLYTMSFAFFTTVLTAFGLWKKGMF
ncbi:MAG TPA: magnesium transporter CorA family protein [Methylomusa anaerophila]|uniref:CorA-like Mg2+ transporter protein n=1 Tax=Methylomusa anaerophila TaxID=1930071 RepID=A0A348AH48_9FIRM|nr:magnesium transporter CorA family protein [Methylomusa anaerophila]BBB90396.1 CorA-like Mg2+ transporter protein [Methylomusa anaerophila]HML90390.1 magnesium transporter CorA family protein [Methylomusa anaerophila]